MREQAGLRWSRARALLAIALGLLAGAAPVARAEMPGHGDHAAGMDEHMNDDPLTTMVLFDELEWQAGDGDDALRWDIRASAGRDFNRLLLRAEGERVTGQTRQNELELLWWHAVSSWWNLVAGVRQDFAPGPDRSFAALGVEGLAPWRVHVEATAYAGESGQTGARLKLEDDLLITNRLILSPRLEADVWGQDDPANDIGSGLSEVRAGLRLRYEIRREFAPYIGLEWDGRFGDTADLARAAGEGTRATRFVAGLRAWF